MTAAVEPHTRRGLALLAEQTSLSTILKSDPAHPRADTSADFERKRGDERCIASGPMPILRASETPAQG